MILQVSPVKQPSSHINRPSTVQTLHSKLELQIMYTHMSPFNRCSDKSNTTSQFIRS